MRDCRVVHGSVRTYLALMTIAVSGNVLAPIGHRGFWRVCKQVARIVRRPNAACDVKIGPDAWMTIYLDDPYWSRLVCKTYEYEEDFPRALNRWMDLDYAFIDCGANFGYWSILLSSTTMGSRPVLAIEPSLSTYRTLRANCSLNGERF